MRYILAELGIEVNFEYEYAIRRMKEYKSEFGGTHIRINISRDDNIVLPEYCHITPSVSGFYWLKFSNGDFGGFRTLLDTDFIIFFARWNKEATEIEIKMADYEHLGGASMELREFSYVGEIINTILPFHNRIMLHSSAVSLDNRGIAFSAPSGTGKSTHTANWRKMFNDCVAINDDTPIIYNNGDGFRIYGSPWSGKTEINTNISAPLKAIVCLEQGGYNHIERISPRISLPFLLNETKFTGLNEIESCKFNIITDILSTTNVYKLCCLPDENAVITCKEKIWSEV